MDDSYFLLIYCTCLCFVDKFLTSIINPLITFLIQIGKSKFNDLRNEINGIKNEMDRLSMADDFAKYIKLQRKLNKLQGELESNVTSQLQHSMKIRYGITYGICAIVNIFYISVCWSNWRSTIVKLPEHWLVPLGSLLSWPTSVPGGISVPVWTIITNLTIKLISKSFAKQS